MEPLEAAQKLIDQKLITEAQWNLYFLADQFLGVDERERRPLTLRFGDQSVSAKRVAFDVELPGILVVEGMNKQKSYWAWSELIGVILPAPSA